VAPLETAPTARLHAAVLAMLERHGVLTREAVASEEVAGGFSGVYPILRAMEEAGKIRRGYFVEGLGAAQFALPGAVDRLRSMREQEGVPAVHLLAASDPANPYGASLPWPRGGGGERRSPARMAGAYVVLVGGRAAFYLERGGHSLVSLPAAADGDVARAALGAWRDLVESGRQRELLLSRVDGVAVAASPWKEQLEEAGFVPGYRGYALRLAPSR
jgi:ATP-dependent Lhr-like helicase